LFHFTADTDHFNTQVTASEHGGPFGLTGLLFSVVMEDASAFSDNFEIINPNFGALNKSGITINTPSAVPVPAAIWLFGSGLLAMAGRRNKLLAA
jgi:hypothetical protein